MLGATGFDVGRKCRRKARVWVEKEGGLHRGQPRTSTNRIGKD